MQIILSSLLLLGCVFSAEADEKVSVMEGDSVTLLTNLTTIENDDTIVWAFGSKGLPLSQITRKKDLTSLYITDDVGFTGRLQVDQNTGSLTIRNIRHRHSGQYKLTISTAKTTTRIFHVVVFDVVGETDGVKSVSVMEGESVTLQNDATELQKDDLIVWRFGDKGVLLAKIDVETNTASLNDSDKRFKNILQLDPQTGSLTITTARPEHTGHYEVQIRGRESSQQFILSVRAVSGHSPALIAAIVVSALLVAGLLAGVVIYYRHKISKLENQVVEEKKMSVIEGRTVALNTETKLQDGDEIRWWFNDGTVPVTEMNNWSVQNRDLDCDVSDERFRNKLQLGGRTGDLIISFIRTIHAGVYKVQISGKNRKTKHKRFIVTVEVNKVQGEVGKPLVLNSQIKTQTGDLILWTFGVKNCLVVKGESETTSFSESFRDRVDLDHKTGSLTIKNITNEDFGHFQLQVINNERNRFRRFNVTEEQDSTDNAKGLEENNQLLLKQNV